MFKRRIGHALIDFTNLDLIFWHDVVHALVDALSVALSIIIFLEKYMTDPTTRKKQNRPKL